MQYASLVRHILNVFIYLKRSNLLNKTDQRERGFSVLNLNTQDNTMVSPYVLDL